MKKVNVKLKLKKRKKFFLDDENNRQFPILLFLLPKTFENFHTFERFKTSSVIFSTLKTF